MDPATVQVQEATCARVPAEVLLEIFAFLTAAQGSLHACSLTCRLWNRVCVPVMWRRPSFSRLASVELFAAALLSTQREFAGGLRRVSPYARFIETLSFSALPEPDRNNPHLATLLDSIVNCMAVVAPAQAATADGALAGWETVVPAPALKRSRSLSRDEAARPHSAVGLQMAEGGSCAIDPQPLAGLPMTLHAASEAELGEKQMAKAESSTDVAAAIDDSRLSYHLQTTPFSGAGEPSGTGAATNNSPVYTSSLRQLDLRFCKGVRNYSLQRLAPKLASLRVLNLAGGLRTDITIAKLSQHMFLDLQRISLAWTSNLTDFGVSELVQRCRSIEFLDLTYCTQIEDTSMFAIAHSLTNLVALSVAYCAGVTDIGVREVATGRPHLRILNVTKCLRVTDRMRKSLDQQKVTFQCASFEPFSIYSHSPLKRRLAIPPP
ncbi:hypothetical protein GGF46_004872 [Coemansia sp. RSA 552]|nr:hypothetical protein GGF46_004872 [Coemansia sp. RSA 552]